MWSPEGEILDMVENLRGENDRNLEHTLQKPSRVEEWGFPNLGNPHHVSHGPEDSHGAIGFSVCPANSVLIQPLLFSCSSFLAQGYLVSLSGGRI